MTELIGWIATAVFVSSYFFEPAWLRRVQMMGAVLWACYGLLLGATPVIVTNLLVLVAASWTARRGTRAVAST